METKTLTEELLYKMDAYWRAANYLSVGQIYLYDNPLLKRPLTLADVKHMLLGHWGPPWAELHLRRLRRELNAQFAASFQTILQNYFSVNCQQKCQQKAVTV